MLSVQLSRLQALFHFGVMDNFAVLLMMGIQFVSGFVKGISSCNDASSTHSFAQWQLFQNLWPHWTWLAVLQNNPNVETITIYWRKIEERPYFQSPGVFCNTAECRGVCNRHDHQPPTHLHGATPDFHTISNGPTALRECKFPIKRIYKNLRLLLLQEPNLTAKKNFNLFQRPCRRWHCAHGLSCNHPLRADVRGG